MNIMESMKVENLKNGGWYINYETFKADVVHESLMHDLISKKLEGCSEIKSIRRRQNYNGTITIIVTYKGGTTRRVYTVKDH